MSAELNIIVDSISSAGIALQQNGVPVLRSVIFENTSDEVLHDLRVDIRSEPAFFKPLQFFISEIASGTASESTDFNLLPDFDFLASVDKSIIGKLYIEITKPEQAEPFAGCVKDLKIFAGNEWFGYDIMPELLAAFIDTNSSFVSDILKRTSELMKNEGDSGELDGYRSGNKGRVILMLKCIYKSLSERNLSYHELPDNFADRGIVVQSADDIAETLSASSLDISLLFAGLLEGCGLNPLIMLNSKKVYIACHVTQYNFPDAILDDLQAIRKRVEISEIAVLDPVTVTDSRSGFDLSMISGAKYLSDETNFHYALDLKQARALGVRPVNEDHKTADTVIENSIDDSFSFDRQSMDIGEAIDGADQADDTPVRVQRWRSKLLDLSRRNRLLNFKDTKQSIHLAYYDLDRIEDAVSEGVEFRIYPKPEVFNTAENDPRNLTQIERTSGTGPVLNFIREEFKSKRLHSFLDENELLKRLKELYRAGRSDMEEGGVNTLFLTVGFLSWTDGTGASMQRYRAPLILVPVRIDRQTVRSGYTLSLADGDSVANITLLEMLRRDFGREIAGLNPPPGDDSGLDVREILKIFKNAILDIKGWEIQEELWLGRLFFNKFIMWDDMNRRLDDLRKSPVVGHLIKGDGTIFEDGIEPVLPHEVDTCIEPEHLFCPMSADSSQLAAVISAARGKNFVLHGPPGTGKSQTITNLIAYCLGEGKTVLFVAEKRAALEVVQRRLQRIGLAPFCLELHSNKAGKADVLRQFKEVLELGDKIEPSAWVQATNDLKASRKVLSGYVQALHKTYPCGLTPYSAFSYLLSQAGNDDLISSVGPFEKVKLFSGELGAMLDAGNELVAQAREIAPYLFDKFEFARPVDWTPAWEQSATSAAVSLGSETVAMGKMLEGFCVLIDCPSPSSVTWDGLKEFSQLAMLLQSLPRMPENFFMPDWEVFYEEINPIIKAGLECDAISGKLGSFDMEAVAVFDVSGLRDALKSASERFILFKKLELSKARKKVCSCLKPDSTRKISYAELPGLMDDFEHYTLNRKIVDSIPEQLSSRIGHMFRKLDTDWQSVDMLASLCQSLNDSVRRAVGRDHDLFKRITNAIGEHGSATVREFTPEDMRAFNTVYGNFMASLGVFKTMLHVDEVVAASRGAISAAAQMADSVLSERQHLRRWCIWNQAREKCMEAGLYPVVVSIDSGELSLENVLLAIKKRYYEFFINAVIETDEVLRNFIGGSHDGTVEKFTHIDAEMERLAQEMVIAKLTSRLPSGRLGDCPAASELGLLKRECEKKTRHKPVRSLLESIPTILTSLKPCMLMSPISVAQYLPPGSNNFDIIVFDEASQITVWDAIGAMARGRQVIIVGDPKQLPPTTFFQRLTESDDADESDIEELESILDECKAGGVADLYLQWHYRSRHESLIAFSNHNYYENSLMTFPSSVQESKSLGVSLNFVEDGIYDKSRTRTNEREARALVDAVVERLRDPDLADKSTGVVTFSKAQQNLIEDLMDEKRSEFPEIEKFFSDSNHEPFFVKNLENVQGDERDAIYFSICYGYDSKGKFAMNFGPLNRPGGERRLNVAVTRAKEKVVVFSSVTSLQIDTSRTQALGAVHLRKFLEYAERGNTQVVFSKTKAAGFEEDGLENEVASFLRIHGFNIDRNVGFSGYKIDMSVRVSGDTERYVIGIECDGEQYRGCASARDRDKLRRMVLEGLGWRLTRVWSVSWWFDKEGAQRRLLDEVNAAVEGLPPPTGPSRQLPEYSSALMQDFAPSFAAEIPDEHEKVYIPSEFVGDYAKSQSNFNLDFGPQIISEQMRRIINSEGPIVESLLFKRVIKEWGFSRIGSAMAVVLDRSVPLSRALTKQFGERVYWPEGVDYRSYRDFRTPGNTDDARRSVKELPLEEIANAMKSLQERFRALPDETLLAESAKIFGFGRLTATVREHLEQALKKAKSRA
jgi:very-short-patch-repair endonuclease/DNA polymerase III delta prime subunit